MRPSGREGRVGPVSGEAGRKEEGPEESTLDLNGRSWSEPGVDGSSPWIIEDAILVLGQFNLVLIDIYILFHELFPGFPFAHEQ